MSCSFFGFQLLKIIKHIYHNNIVIFELIFQNCIYDIKKFVCKYQIKKNNGTIWKIVKQNYHNDIVHCSYIIFELVSQNCYL